MLRGSCECVFISLWCKFCYYYYYFYCGQHAMSETQYRNITIQTSLPFVVRIQTETSKANPDSRQSRGRDGSSVILNSPTELAQEEVTVLSSRSTSAVLFTVVRCRRGLIWACSEWAQPDLEVRINFACGLVIKWTGDCSATPAHLAFLEARHPQRDGSDHTDTHTRRECKHTHRAGSW